MGCFSWLCKECGKGIKSTSFHGDECKLFLLRDGEVVQQMEGEYNSYGSVFIPDTQSEEVEHPLRKSQEWADPTPEVPLDPYKVSIIGEEGVIWHRICDLILDKVNLGNGMAAVHKACFKEIPTTRSADDPNQGWGDEEDEYEIEEE